MRRRRSRHNEERRRAILRILLKTVLVVAVFALASYYAYETGVRVTRGEAGSLQERLDAATADLTAARGQIEADQERIATAAKQAEDFRTLYEQVKPSDDIRDLTLALRERIAGGIAPGRLMFAIRGAHNLHDCSTLAAKRVPVRTPRLRDARGAMAARLGDLISVTVEGEGANDGQEEWFDPQRPVTVRLAGAGLKDRATPVHLPYDDTVLVRGAEVHVTVTTSPVRGYVDVAGEKCGL